MTYYWKYCIRSGTIYYKPGTSSILLSKLLVVAIFCCEVQPEMVPTINHDSILLSYVALTRDQTMYKSSKMKSGFRGFFFRPAFAPNCQDHRICCHDIIVLALYQSGSDQLTLVFSSGQCQQYLVPKQSYQNKNGYTPVGKDI